jgi:hypothetical protein
MPAHWAIFIIALAVASIVMVVAMVPLSLELIEASRDGAHHRQRIAAMGPIGRLSAALVADSVAPTRFWAILYALTWAALLGIFAWVVAISEPQQRSKNLLICLLMPVAWFTVQFAVIALGRAITRANPRSSPLLLTAFSSQI